MSDREELSARVHLRIALSNARIAMLAVFLQGVLTGWATSLWGRSPVGFLIMTLGPTLLAGYLGWAYYRTQGLYNHTGFGPQTDKGE